MFEIKIYSMPKKSFADFTRQYSLQKTLRFELRPIGKTRENIEKANPNFIHDQEIEHAYQILKPVFDRLHAEFINNGLESDYAKSFDVKEYFLLYDKLRNEVDRDGKNLIEKKLFDIEKKLRDFFKEVWEQQGEVFKIKSVDQKVLEKMKERFANAKDVKEKKKIEREIKKVIFLKEKGFKVLTEAGILKYIKTQIDDFVGLNLRTKEGVNVKKEDLEKALGTAHSKGIFDGFFSYLGGFNLNRENYYSTEEKATAVANRIVAENLPKFCDNVLEFERRKHEYLKVYKFLEGKNIELKGRSQDGQEIDLEPISEGLFKLENFVNCLSQPEIERYNLQIGNANNLVNRYNQQQVNKKDKLRLFKALYKQIGCGERRDFLLAIKNDKDLEDILEDVKVRGAKFFKNTEKLIGEILELDNFEGVYFSDKALNTISSKYFANWGSLKEILKDAKVFKKEKDEIKIPQTIELIDLFKALETEGAIFKESFKDNDVDKQNIVKDVSLSNGEKLLKMIFIDIEANNKSFEYLKYKLPTGDYRKDSNTQVIKEFLDLILFSNQILKYFKVRENKIKGSYLNSDIYTLLDGILFEENPTHYYDLVRNYLTKKPTEQLGKLKLNFNNSLLAGGWDDNKISSNYCAILKDTSNNKYLAILTHQNTDFFNKQAIFGKGRNKVITKNPLYNVDGEFYEKMDYKQIATPTGVGGFVRKCFKAAQDYGWICPSSCLNSEGKIIIKNDEAASNLEELIDCYKDFFSKYEKDGFKYKNYNFVFKNSDQYGNLNEFFIDLEKQAYMLSFPDNARVNKATLDEAVEDGKVYLFEIRNKDNNLSSKLGYKKSTRSNLHTIYWNAVFDNVVNRPKLNGQAEIFYRPVVKDLIKDKDKTGKIIRASKKRFDHEKFLFHCPITLNFGAKSSKLNDEINKTMVTNQSEVCFIGIDRGEKHLAYYSVIDQNGRIFDQGSFNEIVDKNNGKKHNYAEKLDERAGYREEARKNWRTIGTIKELKNGYISQVVRKIVDLAIEYNAYIVLENLNVGFKRGRQKIEKSVYQKLELAIAKKLNFLVHKNAKDGELMSVQNALQLTPPVTNFQDIGTQCGIMLYIRANYTSQTDPITGWRKKIYFNSTTQENLKAEICDKFDKIGFDGDDYYFEYKDEDTGKRWKLWSGKNGVSLDRYRGKRDKHGEWRIEKVDVKVLLDEVFENFDKGKDLKDQILDKGKLDNSKVSTLKYAVELIQQIRNSGPNDSETNMSLDDDFILSPVRNEKGEHFDSRSEGAIVPNGDANGAYNIARKGLMAFEQRICVKPEKPDLYIADKDWDNFAVEMAKQQ